MKMLWLLASLGTLTACDASRSQAVNPHAPVDPPLPISSGKHVFRHRFAEHPEMQSMELNVVIQKHRIRITNPQTTRVFPKGVLAEGELVWHARSGSWIIASTPEDVEAAEVGGCSDGPEVVDLVNRIYWTC